LSTGKTTDLVFYQLERVAEVYGVEITRGWQKLLAKKMGMINPNIISAWKKRGVPNEIILQVADEKGVSSQWLRTGQGDKYLNRPSVPPEPRTNSPNPSIQTGRRANLQGTTQLSDDELELLAAYRKLPQEHKESIVAQVVGVVLTIESRRNAGGGSALKESNSN